jgi:pSer/pThr/pTyr-binding forkhead associated (FHA) protein/tetratricopeptide (TPR) repeat protein
MKLIIEDDEGRKTVVPIVREDVEITIGRQEGNTIRLTERNVSRRHAKLIRRNGSVFVEDLGSYNGVKINGDKIQGNSPVNEGDLVQIGDYDLAIQYEEGARPAPAPKPKADDTAPTQQEIKAVDETPAPDAEELVTPAPPEPSSSTKRRESTSIINPGQLKLAQKRKVADVPVDQAPRLVVVGGELNGREFACIRTEIKIGRTDDNDIAIDHRSLSRNHCKVVREEDGEWKIIDLQSSNGVQVNGEQYAECVLHPGDTVELGHLKLRFCGAGEDLPTETTVPVVGDAKPSSKTLPIAIAAVVLIAALGVGGYFLTKGKKSDAKTPDQAAQTQPVKVTEPNPNTSPDVQVPLQPQQADNAQAQQQPGQQQPAAPADPALVKAVEAGKQLISQGRFADAEKKLAPAVEAKVPGADALLAKARSEISAKGHLAAAQKKLLDKDLAGARAELEQIPDDSVFAPDAGQLEGRVAEAEEKDRRQHDAADAKNHADEQRQAAQAAQNAQASPEPESKQAQARAALRKGKELASDTSKRYKEAIVVLERALALDPSLAEAHFILGTCHARLGNLKKGAYHYEEFVHMAPNDPSAAEVVEVLRTYFKSSGERPRWPLP